MTGPVEILPGDCLAALDAMAEGSVDAVVTDPPYHLTSIVRQFGAKDAAAAAEGADGAFARASRGFMGKAWDGGDIAFRPDTWARLLRVLKPGGHLVAFNHSRTWHRMAVAIEDAGFEVRDSLLWLYGTGFPKSHDVAKGIDKELGAEGWQRPWMADAGAVDNAAREYLPGSPEARAWEGWGTALKPAFEPIVLARKPLSEGSVARQVLATGTGAINIGAARVPYMSAADAAATAAGGSAFARSAAGKANRKVLSGGLGALDGFRPADAGRWPANVLHDGSAEVLARFPVDGEGSVARFFYSAKADAADRRGSDHPTVKPHALMRWLVRLVCPRGGVVLDPFGGSGATAWASVAEGCCAILCEREPEYLADIARNVRRLAGEIAAAEADWRAEIARLADAAGAAGNPAEAARLRARLAIPHPDDAARAAACLTPAGDPAAAQTDLFGG